VLRLLVCHGRIVYNCTMPPPLPNNLFQKPKPDDPDRAEDLLDEIQGVLRKRGAALLVVHGTMALCLPMPHGAGWRAIAQAEVISPIEIRWRPVVWNVAKQ